MELTTQLMEMGMVYGSPIFIRIFKQPGTLEVWVQNNTPTFTLFKTYDICNFSGNLGPKLQVGDMQSPEGFYFVAPQRMNPWSDYHLSFNLGYPNIYDRYHERTGSHLMVHGRCVSIGCYAMTDPSINEIYSLAHAALEQGQPFFRVHVFPFKLEDSQLETFREHRWYDFWVNLKQGYDWFERYKRPPNVTVQNGQYFFEPDV